MKGIIKILPLAITLFSCGKNPQENTRLCCPGKKIPNSVNVATRPQGAASIYQLPGNWTNQDGHAEPLEALKGKVQITAMIFTHCGYACPRMVDNMKAIENRLPPSVRAKTGFVLISFDSEQDTPAQLKSFANARQLDGNWTLLHGSENQVRELSMLLQLQYEKLPGGNFNHSNIITILDSGGSILKQIEGLNPDIRAIANTVSQYEGGQ